MCSEMTLTMSLDNSKLINEQHINKNSNNNIIIRIRKLRKGKLPKPP